jgi:hypothetical protein
VYPPLHDQPATAAGRPGGLAPQGWRRLGGALLGCLLVAACSSPNGQQATATSRQPSAGATQRDYWPTTGWRTTTPDQQGMDPQVLDDLDTQVPEQYPQVRSLLVVRHGYLVYERYWHGVDAADGHNSYSVTKSVTSALVGIALGERHLQGLDQTVGELLAAHLPNNTDPRLGRVTLQQLLTMTGGLAGDDRSTGGDEGLIDRQFNSRDWVGHILGRRLACNPGTALPTATPARTCCRRSLPTPPASPPWRLRAPGSSNRSASAATTRPSRRSSPGRRPRPRTRPTSRPPWHGPRTRGATTSAPAG